MLQGYGHDHLGIEETEVGVGQRWSTSQAPIDTHEKGYTDQYGQFDSRRIHFNSNASAEEDMSQSATFSTLRGMNRFQQTAISSLQAQVTTLQKQVSDLLTGKELPGIEGDSHLKLQPTSDNVLSYEHTATATPRVLPKCRQCSWSEFMNKIAFEPTEHAIEVLHEEPAYYRVSKNFVANHKSTRGWRSESEQAASTAESSTVPIAHSSIPERIRINSPFILNALAGIDHSIDSSRPLVMLRPFKFLIHYEHRIRDILQGLKDDCKRSTNTKEDPPNRDKTATKSSEESAQPKLSMKDPSEELQHLQCLADFLDQYIEPEVCRLRECERTKIQFKDLWYIFKPGDDIYMPVKQFQRNIELFETAKVPETFRGRYNRLWRVAGATGGRWNLASTSRPGSSTRQNPFTVNLYYIDFDGKYFIPITHAFAIMPFDGEREVDSLDFFPVRFLPNWRSTVKHHFEMGKVTSDWIANWIANSSTHFYYSGPTLLAQPCGCGFKGTTLEQDYVESEVIVDFRTALLENQSWRHDPIPWKVPSVFSHEVIEMNPVNYWTSIDKDKLHYIEHDVVYNDNHIDIERALVFKAQEQIFAPIPSSWICNESCVPEKDTALLPARVFAYVLRTRTFAPLWLWALKPIKAHRDCLQNLHLKHDSLKDTVNALVKTHFLRQQRQQQSSIDDESAGGRGRGLIILLHGAPGVGKTFTAESIAAANGRPLFQISCGDLGVSPEVVEKSLREIFRYAQIWKCVLLLDECDVFFAQRNREDLTRNSLVCVFLRVLEFYSGVLFLTTNRVGVIDEAVRSRITWDVLYNPLTWKQTKAIWKTTVKILQERNPNVDIDKESLWSFAKEHYDANWHSKTIWNGRQIQNAFKVANYLAERDHSQLRDRRDHGDQDLVTNSFHNDGKCRITAAHFQMIAANVTLSDQYLRQATGFTGRQRAFNAMERADDYNIDENIGTTHKEITPVSSNRERGPSFSAQQLTRAFRSPPITHDPMKAHSPESAINQTLSPYPNQISTTSKRKRNSSHSTRSKPSFNQMFNSNVAEDTYYDQQKIFLQQETTGWDIVQPSEDDSSSDDGQERNDSKRQYIKSSSEE